MKTAKEINKKKSQTGAPVSGYEKKAGRVFAPGADRWVDPVVQLYGTIGNQGVQRLLNPGKVDTPPERESDTGIPGPVLAKMEHAFQTDFSAVRVHADSSHAESMGALAYARGNDIHFAPGKYNPGTREGQELLGHELAHVHENRKSPAGVTRWLKGGEPVNDNPGLERNADRLGRRAAQFPFTRGGQLGMDYPSPPVSAAPVMQFQIAYPDIDGTQKKVNTKYAGHTLSCSTSMPNTGCGQTSFIETAGEHANSSSKSDPGDPYDSELYKAYGLLQDPGYTASHAVIRMHMINHNLDPTTLGANGTQGNPHNIFLGTQRSNTNHLNEVEKILKDTLIIKKGTKSLPSKKNNDYETAINNSEKLSDSSTPAKEYVYWDNSHAADFNKITNTKKLIDASKGTAGTDIDLTGKTGKAFELDKTNMWNDHPAHLWLKYEVTASYPPGFTGTPKYVQDNYTNGEKKCGANMYTNLTNVFGKFKTEFAKHCNDAVNYYVLNTWFSALKYPGAYASADDYIKDGIIGQEVTNLKLQKTGDKMMEDVNKKFTNYNDDPVSGYLDDIITGVTRTVRTLHLVTGSGSNFQNAIDKAKTEAITPTSAPAGGKRKAGAMTGPGYNVVEDMKALNNFKQFWAHNAFPPTFDCKVDYYYASYEKSAQYHHQDIPNKNLRTDM